MRRELRKEHDAHLERLRGEQEAVVSRYIQKERELSDQLFRERQSLQENMNIVHNREVELSRKREVLEKTQLLAEGKMRESERLLTTRSAELEYLSQNLQQRISEEKARVTHEWHAQTQKRDDIIAKLSEANRVLEHKLERKLADLVDRDQLIADYTRELKVASESARRLETQLSEVQHQHSLAASRVAELDTRRAKLEEQLLESSAKEQLCFHHMNELQQLRARVLEQQESHATHNQQLLDKHAAELTAERKSAQSALQQSHQQATVIVNQWKTSYNDILDEIERHRIEEERLKQQVEEEALLNKGTQERDPSDESKMRSQRLLPLGSSSGVIGSVAEWGVSAACEGRCDFTS